MPLSHISGEKLEAILRTFFTVFPSGEVWWGFNNLTIVGSKAQVAGYSDIVYPDPDSELALLLDECGIHSKRVSCVGGSHVESRPTTRTRYWRFSGTVLKSTAL